MYNQIGGKAKFNKVKIRFSDASSTRHRRSEERSLYSINEHRSEEDNEVMPMNQRFYAYQNL